MMNYAFIESQALSNDVDMGQYCGGPQDLLDAN